MPVKQVIVNENDVQNEDQIQNNTVERQDRHKLMFNHLSWILAKGKLYESI